MNIIFDLGKVVFKWEFENNIDNYFKDIQKRKHFIDEIFHHNDWIELDRGTLDVEDAIERGSIRTGLPQKDVSNLMNKIPQSLILDMETLKLVERIKNDNNHRLFVLSNMHTACADYIEKEFDFWDLFEGIVFSCRVKMVKPEIQIYDHLLNKYDLTSTDSIFIDDREENLIPAEKLGMNTIQFLNPAQCEKDLTALGVFK